MHHKAAVSVAGAASRLDVTTVSGDGGYFDLTDAMIGAVAYKVMWFNANGNVIVTGPDVAVDYGIIDSGATGGRASTSTAGGGGSGCGLENEQRTQTLTAGTYPVVVGAAATGPTVDQTRGTDGNASS